METAVENTKQKTGDKHATSPEIEDQLAFRRRYRNSNLERFTVRQLKEKAERLNLNISKLKHRWQIIDLLEKSRHDRSIGEASSSYRTYLKKLSFLDFPAEIRNQIYGYAVTTESCIFSCSHYWQAKRLRNCKHHGRRKINGKTQSMFTDGDERIVALKLLARVSRVIRAEAISYYYSNNEFVVCDHRTETGMQELYTSFLGGIKDEGRMHLRHLTIKEFVYPGYSKVHYTKFMDLLHQCQLQYLDISMHPMWLLKEEAQKIRESTRGKVVHEDFDIPAFAKEFKPLAKLQRLQLGLQAWSQPFIYDQPDTLSADMREELEKEFKIMLPNLNLTIEIRGW
jgi:hypothetical protein